MGGAFPEGRAALIPYLTAGYPTLEDAAGVGEAFLTAGADILEIGIPFSDPLADGPTIQDTTTRAIENGADLRYCFDLASRFADRGAVHQTYRNRLRSLGLVRATYKKSEKGELPSEGTMNPLSTRNLQTPATASNA
jgi:tryptophan synthase alpha chain